MLNGSSFSDAVSGLHRSHSSLKQVEISEIFYVLMRSVQLKSSFLASLEANVGIFPGATEALGRSGRLVKSDRLMTKNFPSSKLLTKVNFCRVSKLIEVNFKLMVGGSFHLYFAMLFSCTIALLCCYSVSRVIE